MKYILSTILLATCFFACKQDVKIKIPGSGGKDSTVLTSIQWLDSSQNFGEVTEGEKVNITYKFKNTGSSPLIIEHVQPACGCTEPTYSKEPLAPGEQGEIISTFNSQGQQERVYKTLSVTTNTNPDQHILIFQGTVKKSN